MDLSKDMRSNHFIKAEGQANDYTYGYERYWIKIYLKNQYVYAYRRTHTNGHLHTHIYTLIVVLTTNQKKSKHEVNNRTRFILPMKMNGDKVIKINDVASRYQEKQQQSKTESIKVH